MNFPVLNLPDASLRFENREGKPFVFDIIRKKYVALQPEEWVRQHLIHYLIYHRAYPKSMLRIEGGMHYNKLQKRTDLLVYDRNLRPFLLLECKAPDVKLSNKSIEQLSVYNQNYQARYLALSNGLDHKIFEMDYKQRKFMPLSEYPVFQM